MSINSLSDLTGFPESFSLLWSSQQDSVLISENVAYGFASDIKKILKTVKEDIQYIRNIPVCENLENSICFFDIMVFSVIDKTFSGIVLGSSEDVIVKYWNILRDMFSLRENGSYSCYSIGMHEVFHSGLPCFIREGKKDERFYPLTQQELSLCMQEIGLKKSTFAGFGFLRHRLNKAKTISNLDSYLNSEEKIYVMKYGEETSYSNIWKDASEQKRAEYLVQDASSRDIDKNWMKFVELINQNQEELINLDGIPVQEVWAIPVSYKKENYNNNSMKICPLSIMFFGIATRDKENLDPLGRLFSKHIISYLNRSLMFSRLEVLAEAQGRETGRSLAYHDIPKDIAPATYALADFNKEYKAFMEGHPEILLEKPPNPPELRMPDGLSVVSMFSAAESSGLLYELPKDISSRLAEPWSEELFEEFNKRLILPVIWEQSLAMVKDEDIQAWYDENPQRCFRFKEFQSAFELKFVLKNNDRLSPQKPTGIFPLLLLLLRMAYWMAFRDRINSKIAVVELEIERNDQKSMRDVVVSVWTSGSTRARCVEESEEWRNFDFELWSQRVKTMESLCLGWKIERTPGGDQLIEWEENYWVKDEEKCMWRASIFYRY